MYHTVRVTGWVLCNGIAFPGVCLEMASRRDEWERKSRGWEKKGEGVETRKSPLLSLDPLYSPHSARFSFAQSLGKAGKGNDGRFAPSIKLAGTYLYNWVERCSVRVACLTQEHKTMSPARAQTRAMCPLVQRTNHKALRLSALVVLRCKGNETTVLHFTVYKGTVTSDTAQSRWRFGWSCVQWCWWCSYTTPSQEGAGSVDIATRLQDR